MSGNCAGKLLSYLQIPNLQTHCVFSSSLQTRSDHVKVPTEEASLYADPFQFRKARAEPGSSLPLARIAATIRLGLRAPPDLAYARVVQE